MLSSLKTKICTAPVRSIAFQKSTMPCAAAGTQLRSVSMTANGASPARVLVDVHSHMYYPTYMDIMRNRSNIPKVVKNSRGEERLVILPNESDSKSDDVGRPIGEEYFDVGAKISFMDAHNISHSVVSLANPWLDFMRSAEERAEAPGLATLLNSDLNTLCRDSANTWGNTHLQQGLGLGGPRLFGFGIIPTTAPDACAKAVRHIAEDCEHLRGIILGTSGVNSTGLDGPDMEPVYAELEKHGLVLFIHPHYGLPAEDMSRYGHSLELALGFPMETSIAISRLILSGVLDRYPNLKVYVAHAGGVLPYLQGRIDSCVGYEKHIKLQKKPSDYLKDLYYDAIIYNPDCLDLLVRSVGSDRIMYGTDHPFFPPEKKGDAIWKSAAKIQEIVPEELKTEIYGDVAVNLFGLGQFFTKAGAEAGKGSSPLRSAVA